MISETLKINTTLTSLDLSCVNIMIIVEENSEREKGVETEDESMNEMKKMIMIMIMIMIENDNVPNEQPTILENQEQE